MMWELYQQNQISSAKQSASRAEQKSMTIQDSVKRLEDRVDSLSLVCQAMWELLSDDLSDAETRINQKVEEIDLRDGKRDGKMNRVATTCQNCERQLHKRHLRCMYCGFEADRESLFQS